MNQCFEYKGKFYVIKRDEHEPMETYMKRVWFILDKTHEDSSLSSLSLSYNKLIIMSKKYVNEQILKCSYD